MVHVKVLGEFYLSQVINRPIYDAEGRRVGRLRDMAIRWGGISPHVTGIKYAKGIQNHIDINDIDRWDEQGIKLKGALAENKLRHLQADEIYVTKWLLDKQIIDLKGSKLVRVNDIKLSWVNKGHTSSIILVAMDIGLGGLLRRIGLEFLVKTRAPHLVGWQYIKPLENRTANLRLVQEKMQISQLHPADIADIIEELDHQERSQFINMLDNDTAAEALAEINLDDLVEIIERMDATRASDILEEMAPDEAADVLGELPEEKSSQLLNLMEPEEAQEVRELMDYPDDTAGSLMTTEYIAFPSGMTAEEAINRLRELAPAAETIYYLYVVDAQGVLMGVLSLRDLIIARPQELLSEFMHTRVVKVNRNDDHSTVLDVVRKYNLLAVPVVDDQGLLLGIITVDDVLDTLLPDRSNLDTFFNFMLPLKAIRR